MRLAREGTLLKQLGGSGAHHPAQTGRLTGISAIAAVGIALLALAGWLLDARFLAGQWGRAIPMSPSAALALLFLSGGVFSQARWSTRRLGHHFSMACVGISTSLGVLVLAQFIVGFDLGVERALNRTNELFGQIPVGKMSPLTAGSLLLESGALLLLLRVTRWRHAGLTSALLALTATAINLVVIVGYLYGAPLLYGGTTIPMAMPTALSFVLVGAGQTRLAVHSAPALRAWSGDSMRAILLRAFLPPMLLLILLEGWLDTLQPTLASNQALWHSGTALVACVLIAIITAWSARRTGDAVERAEDALRQSEERYRALFDRSLDCVYLTDFEGHFLDANQAALDLLGYRFEDITMLTFGSLLTEDQGPRAMQTVEEILTTGRQQNPTEHRLRRKDGGHAFVETQASLIYRDGRPFAIQGIARDISERKRAEDALREGKEHYQSLIECLGEGVVSVSRQGRVLMANPAAEKIFGMSRGGAIGRELVEIVDPGDMPVLASERARRERGETSAFELRVTRPDGVKRTLRVTATPQYDASGHFQSILAVIRDITEENVLLQRLRLLAHTLDSVDECVSICDPEDRLLFVNRAFLRTYGYEECNLVGENISIVRSPLNSPEVTGGILPGTLAGGWRGELWNRKKDGTDFQIMLNTAAVVDRNGRIEATVGVARDITDGKRAEAELTSARERAESANRAKSEFLAMMSHEIRTPMNGVIGMTGLLLDTPLTPEQREYAETVRKSGDALLTVINDILDFSKIEVGRLQIEHFSFDLRMVIEEVNEMLAPKAEEHDLEFVLEYPSRLPQHFIGDGGRIRQVITNLVGNAVKFTSRGSVWVTVECVGQDTQTAQMRIAVHDTGVGIPPEKLGAIFAKFSQVDSTTTRKYGGTGLGLAISKQLIELMGGSIGVESRLGQGSEFSVILPLRQDPEPSAGADITKLLGLRVLVVDDHDVNRRVLADLTTNWGMRCSSTAFGEEALEALRAAQAGGDRYHFVILDYQMPGMDGATLASAIKAEPAFQEVGVVMLSSIGESPEVRHMEGTSIDAVLVKPVRQGELLSTLAGIWGEEKADDREHRILESKARWAGSFAGLGLRVLVADDSAVNQRVAVLMLEKLGLRADMASSGREAVDLREMIPYDLILMDCQMPEMDGYEATREIRRKEGGKRRTAIVAMTAEAMTGAREQCIEAGMDDYIAKPVRLADMVEALQRWCLKSDEAGNPRSWRGQ